MKRLLIIGTGSIGERHTRCFLATGRAAVGICEPTDAVRKAVADRYDVVGAWSGLEEALQEDWDAALVATPANTHIPIARTLVARGLPVLIEKPLATTLEGVAELRTEAQDAGVLTAVSYNYRAHPALVAMKAALDSGRFGDILQVYGMVGQEFAKYRPAYASVYFADPEKGGGAIQDALPHLVNAGEWLAGPITRVCADAAHRQLPGVTVEDTVHVIARHGEIPANYGLNLYQKPNETAITVVCAGGTVRFEVHRQRWRWMTEADTPWHDEPTPLADRDAWYVYNAEAFLDALEGTAAPRCTLADGEQTLRAMLAVRESLGSGAWAAV